ncbi:hypothetical protein BuS5_02766 [Desulfosarcina sp. BuS5]|nr:hypothetical protein [Desulfosarcina sp. BuS5]WDN89798.1 hypothetical protein BuS5_02766 [Desulfosarcina sp. BuS5]
MKIIKVLNPYDQYLIEELDKTSEGETLSILDESYSLYKDRSAWLPPISA